MYQTVLIGALWQGVLAEDVVGVRAVLNAKVGREDFDGVAEDLDGPGFQVDEVTGRRVGIFGKHSFKTHLKTVKQCQFNLTLLLAVVN